MATVLRRGCKCARARFAIRFQSQSNASTLLYSRWLPNGTQSGRGDGARQLLPFSDVVASARVHAAPEMMHWVRQRIRTRNIQVPCLRGRHKCGQKEDLYTMPSRMALPTGFGQWPGNTCHTHVLGHLSWVTCPGSPVLD